MSDADWASSGNMQYEEYVDFSQASDFGDQMYISGLVDNPDMDYENRDASISPLESFVPCAVADSGVDIGFGPWGMMATNTSLACSSSPAAAEAEISVIGHGVGGGFGALAGGDVEMEVEVTSSVSHQEQQQPQQQQQQQHLGASNFPASAVSASDLLELGRITIESPHRPRISSSSNSGEVSQRVMQQQYLQQLQHFQQEQQQQLPHVAPVVSRQTTLMVPAAAGTDTTTTAPTSGTVNPTAGVNGSQDSYAAGPSSPSSSLANRSVGGPTPTTLGSATVSRRLDFSRRLVSALVTPIRKAAGKRSKHKLDTAGGEAQQAPGQTSRSSSPASSSSAAAEAHQQARDVQSQSQSQTHLQLEYSRSLDNSYGHAPPHTSTHTPAPAGGRSSGLHPATAATLSSSCSTSSATETSTAETLTPARSLPSEGLSGAPSAGPEIPTVTVAVPVAGFPPSAVSFVPAASSPLLHTPSHQSLRPQGHMAHAVSYGSLRGASFPAHEPDQPLQSPQQQSAQHPPVLARPHPPSAVHHQSSALERNPAHPSPSIELASSPAAAAAPASAVRTTLAALDTHTPSSAVTPPLDTAASSVSRPPSLPTDQQQLRASISSGTLPPQTQLPPPDLSSYAPSLALPPAASAIKASSSFSHNPNPNPNSRPRLSSSVSVSSGLNSISTTSSPPLHPHSATLSHRLVHHPSLNFFPPSTNSLSSPVAPAFSADSTMTTALQKPGDSSLDPRVSAPPPAMSRQTTFDGSHPLLDMDAIARLTTEPVYNTTVSGAVAPQLVADPSTNGGVRSPQHGIWPVEEMANPVYMSPGAAPANFIPNPSGFLDCMLGDAYDNIRSSHASPLNENYTFQQPQSISPQQLMNHADPNRDLSPTELPQYPAMPNGEPMMSHMMIDPSTAQHFSPQNLMALPMHQGFVSPSQIQHQPIPDVESAPVSQETHRRRQPRAPSSSMRHMRSMPTLHNRRTRRNGSESPGSGPRGAAPANSHGRTVSASGPSGNGSIRKKRSTGRMHNSRSANGSLDLGAAGIPISASTGSLHPVTLTSSMTTGSIAPAYTVPAGSISSGFTSPTGTTFGSPMDNTNNNCGSFINSSVAPTNNGTAGSVSPGEGGFNFMNFTPEDSHFLMTGVAPSGSSKTKAKRDREANARNQRLLDMVRDSGCNVEQIKSLIEDPQDTQVASLSSTEQPVNAA
ncbi:hypothetical protein BROUX41_001356 [Berkeleyomyces rouxiae]|uniref:uncharacterized protein n=1 Tax=Berkeleyomyces rouxiae TaxID=2035830 RepID=UPI003B7AFA28